jgi:hypothetical protein
MNDLVLYTEARIDIANLWLHSILMTSFRTEKPKVRKLIDQLNTLLTMYQKRFPDLIDKKTELQLEIRLLTRGTPVTEPMSVADCNAIGLDAAQGLSEQQKVAIGEILKKAYRKCAMICHPDRGGDLEDFQELKEAYAAYDLQRITELYLLLSKKRNLFWQSTDEGVEFASTQLNRTQVQMAGMRASPQYRVVQYHIAGWPDRAQDSMRSILLSQIQTLMNELNYLRNNHGQGTKERNESIQIEGHQEESQGDSNRESNQQEEG